MGGGRGRVIFTLPLPSPIKGEGISVATFSEVSLYRYNITQAL